MKFEIFFKDCLRFYFPEGVFILISVRDTHKSTRFCPWKQTDFTSIWSHFPFFGALPNNPHQTIIRKPRILRILFSLMKWNSFSELNFRLWLASSVNRTMTRVTSPLLIPWCRYIRGRPFSFAVFWWSPTREEVQQNVIVCSETRVLIILISKWQHAVHLSANGVQSNYWSFSGEFFSSYHSFADTFVDSYVQMYRQHSKIILWLFFVP